MEGITKISREITALTPETIFSIGGFPVANTTLTIILITVLVILFAWLVVRKFNLMPSGVQVACETIYEELVTLVQQITEDKARAEQLFPAVAAIFVYLLVANLISIIPGLTEVTLDGQSIFRGPTADFNTTFGLAFGAVLVLQWVSIKEWGLWGHFNKYVKVVDLWRGFRKGLKTGMVALIDAFVGLLDIIGELAKVVSLSLRLFGNMYAGSVLMVILLGAFAYVVPSVWLAMNIFAGVLQALVFAALVGAYYMLAIKPESETSP